MMTLMILFFGYPYPHFPLKNMTYSEAFAVDQNSDLITLHILLCSGQL